MNDTPPERMEAEDQVLLRSILDAIDTFKGEEPMVLDVREFPIPTSYMVIASGGSVKQLRAIREEVEGCEPPLHREGVDSQQWMVVDFGHVIVHVMSREARDFYELEALWQDNAVEVG